MTRVLYLVHNLDDPAVERRVRMLQAGGAEMTVAGFSREVAPPTPASLAAAIQLGRTHDARLFQRAAMVARHAANPSAMRGAAGIADVVLARNLEMLVLGARIRRPSQRLVYECLDVHRTMVGSGPASSLLRWLERRLLRSASLLLTSSPAFVREYFLRVQHSITPSLLVENKLLALAGNEVARAGPRVSGPPWTIGWFGNLRCRRSLEELADVATRLEGAAHILVAGRASPAEFPEFLKTAQRPHVDYIGPYSSADLPKLYARCHFAWCIDYFEEGLNSEWLLPNRLYESIACGAVPIAREGTETARWLAARHVGIPLPREGAAAALADLLSSLGGERYGALAAEVAAVPTAAVIARDEDCILLAKAIAG
jgi:succinoglycan biosynthesis protein ExoL